MKKTMRLVTLALAVVMCLMAFAGCGKSEKTDMEYVKDKGELVVGITNFEPMDYQDADGNWIGFDADLAKAFAKSLGVKVKFVEINWKQKIMEINSKNVDCLWNGMTITPDVDEALSCTKPYCNNAQVVVLPKAKADNYQTVESCKTLKFAVEGGSAGKEQAELNKFTFTEFPKQANALMEVQAGTSDAAILDSLMAGAMVGEGTAYPELTYTVQLNSEKYGVAFRKGSDLVDELNKFFDESLKDGSMEELAVKYKVQAALIK